MMNLLTRVQMYCKMSVQHKLCEDDVCKDTECEVMSAYTASMSSLYNGMRQTWTLKSHCIVNLSIAKASSELRYCKA